MKAGTEPVRPPYVGLVPYSEDDAAFFFGRTRERELIIANLFASRLTLLYGPSGVGKSSVLRAGVARSLRRNSQAGNGSVSGLAVVVFNLWRDDPMVALNDAIAQTVGESANGHGEDPRARSLVDTLQSWTDRINGQLLVILDQFEEYFLYHGHIDGDGTFAREFPRAVNHEDLDVNFLVSIREDAVAKLDRFKGRIPDLFENYLRIDHLRREAARTAIEGPITQYNELLGNGTQYRIEPELIDAVLEQVRTGQLVLGQTGIGAVKGADDDPARVQIETSHLQLVMRRLWREETSAGSQVLRLETLERLGGSQRIVQEHVDEAMSTLSSRDQDLAARVFKQLVTPSGTKIAHTAKDLAAFADAERATLTPVLERLAGSDLRVLRPVSPPPDQPDASRFEIFHDVLASAVLDWRARWVHEQEQEQASEVERQRRAAEERARHKVRRAQVLSAVMAALLFVTALFAWHLERTKRATQSRELAAEAISLLDIDPAMSLRMARDGLARAKTGEAEEALRRALPLSHVRAVMAEHESGVNTVSFNPEGSAVVTASRDGTARVWDVSTGGQLAKLTGHKDWVRSAAFSPDGSRVVTASHDGTARVWDVSTGSELFVLDDHADAYFVLAASFSPDGTALVTASGDGTARVWNAQTGEQTALLQPHTGPVYDARFSPDGTHVVTADEDGRVRVWDARTGEQQAQLDAHRPEWWVYEAAFSPDGKSVVTAGSDSYAYVWRWQTSEEPVSLFQPTTHEISDVEFSPDGRFVVTVWEKVARVYRADTGGLVTELRGHTDFVNRARFSPDGTRIVTVSRDGHARLWEVSSGALLAELIGHRDNVSDAVFSPDGHVVVTASMDGTARVWEPPAVRVLLGYRDWVLAAAFSNDGAYVVGAGRGGTARVWRVEDGREEAALIAEDAQFALEDARFSPDGRYVVTADVGGWARIWDWRKGELIASSGQMWPLTGAAFNPRGDLVVTAGSDGVARIWEWQKPDQPLRFLTGHKNLIALRAAVFSPDGSLVVTASEDRTARVWDTVTGALVVTLRGHEGAVTDAAFSTDGTRIVTAGAEGTARIWDWRRPDEPPVVLEGHRSWLSGASFDAEGRRVVTGTSDGTTGVWDAETGRNLAFLRQHGDSVNSAVFSPDGQRILTASDDQTARIYACETCGSLEKLEDLAERRLRYVPEQPTGGAAPERALSPSSVSINALQVGDCYNDPAADADPSVVMRVPCDQPHDNEIFAVLGHPAGWDEPFDSEAVEAYLFERCQGEPFQTYVGEAYGGSTHRVWGWWPTEQSWADGDRRLVCVLYNPQGQLTGSMRDDAAP